MSNEDLTDVSGIAASRLHPGFFYMHNGHGGPTGIYIIDEHAQQRAKIRLRHFPHNDVEDVAVGKCHQGSSHTCIYIGKTCLNLPIFPTQGRISYAAQNAYFETMFCGTSKTYIIHVSQAVTNKMALV